MPRPLHNSVSPSRCARVTCGAVTTPTRIANIALSLAVCMSVVAPRHARAQTDVVARLSEQVASGETRLEFHKERGYLDSLLEALRVDPASQSLVFTKTSLQRERITPSNPRAVYFNDHVYIGWIPNGEILEITAIDPKYGATFYSLNQTQNAFPSIRRDIGNCVACHESRQTGNVPGLLLRSVYPDHDGYPNSLAGSFLTTDSSPFAERYGGWYVTGTHGAMRHMGNVARAREAIAPRDIPIESGANWVSLNHKLDTQKFPAPGSDLVALMVLTHHAQAHNEISRLAIETRSSLHHDEAMRQALSQPDPLPGSATARRVARAADRLARTLLFVDEFQLTNTVRGSSAFASRYAALGPVDAQGRSFRSFDLKSRLFRHRCSPLILSPSIDQLPEPARNSLAVALKAYLGDPTKDAPIPADEQRVITSMLNELKPQLLQTDASRSAETPIPVE